MIWFSADHHFWHKNVIEYCNRPFGSVEEMNEALIENHNKLVHDSDDVYLLGDLVFGGAAKITDILSRMNGQKVLILGNHDFRNFKTLKRWYASGLFKDIDTKAELDERGHHFLMSHFPYKTREPDARTFEEQLSDRGDWLLHGHVHQHWRKKDRMINVGVDVWGFQPVSYDQILSLKEEP